MAVLLGIFFAVQGTYGLARGTGITIKIGEMVVGAQEGGIIFSVVGIILLLGGIALTYVTLKLSRLFILSFVLGMCSLLIPVILFGLGHSLVAAIVTIVFGYPFLATLFWWLTR